MRSLLPVRTLMFVRSHRPVLISVLAVLILSLVSILAFFLVKDHANTSGKQENLWTEESILKSGCFVGANVGEPGFLVEGTIKDIASKGKLFTIACKDGQLLNFRTDDSTRFLVLPKDLLSLGGGETSSKGEDSPGPKGREVFVDKVANGTTIQANLLGTNGNGELLARFVTLKATE